MKKIVSILFVLAIMSLGACSKNASDTAIVNYEKAITAMTEALASGDSEKVKIAENELTAANAELEKVVNTLSWSQKIKLAEITVKGSGAALQGLGTGLGDLMQSEEVQSLTEDAAEAIQKE